MRNKRGVSPLVAWVLLISFAIAMGLLVTKWVVDNVKNVEFEPNKDVYCNDVAGYISDVCKVTTGQNANKIQVTLKNTGNFKITRISLGRETTHKPEEWCLKLNAQNFNPQSDYVYYLTIGKMTGNIIGNESTVYQNCDTVIENINQDERMTSIAMVPWISIEDKATSCIDKKVELDNLNVPDCP